MFGKLLCFGSLCCLLFYPFLTTKEEESMIIEEPVEEKEKHLLLEAVGQVIEKIPVDSLSKEQPIATLSIPKIQLKQDLYDKNSVENDLSKHIIFLSSSSKPMEKGGNVIIAGHSGLGSVNYFHNLYKLYDGDDIYLTYLEKTYHYQVVKIYKVPKTGNLEMIRDPNQKSITLITCYDRQTQLIIVGEQI